MANILVVEDEKDIRTLVREILENAGHAVVEAQGGQEALDHLGKEGHAPVDLILLDIMMPSMDGYTVNNRLQQNENTRSIPVVILTAKGKMRDTFEMASNVAAFVDKPFTSSELIQTCEKAVAKKK